MPRKPVRKRLDHRKKAKSKRQKATADTSPTEVPEAENITLTVREEGSCDSPIILEKNKKLPLSPIVDKSPSSPALDHSVRVIEGEFKSGTTEQSSEVSVFSADNLPANISTPGSVEIEFKERRSTASNDHPCEPDIEVNDLPNQLMSYLVRRVPKQWGVRVSDEGAYVMLFSLGIECALQRVIYTKFDGSDIRFIVHNKILPSSHEVYINSLLKPHVPLSSERFEDFASVLLSAVNAVQDYKMCVAIDSPHIVEQWPKHPTCRLDENSFLEENYTNKSLRTAECELLVAKKKKRCGPCSRYLSNIKQREGRRSSEIKPQTRHDYLSPNSLKKVLKTRKMTVRSKAAKIKYQSERIAKLLEKEAVHVDEDLHEDLSSAFEDADGLVKVFWTEQKKAYNVKDARGMKWHPFMLRWALHMKSLSSTAYRAMRESGFIKLPSERTLYEYSHANPTKEGIQEHVVKRLGEAVQKFDDDFKKYHVVMFDEMYVFKNVVYNKGTGEITGYVQLDDVEKELLQLEKDLDDEKTEGNPAPTATTMLKYLVKGVANGVKDVVACFTASGLNVDELHTRTWDVIWHLEMAGVKVIALVADGSAVNHLFFQRHPPLTITASGVVFDTLNIFSADGRPIFFFNDPPHLLKTIRNCFANSGAHKRTRLMKKNGQVITWQTIITIFKSEEGKDLRYCHKLSNLHVHLNSYSIMKVYVAAQVMSRTVAAYIEQCNLPGTAETVKFIRYVNDFFDCLNGAHSSQAGRSKNTLLAKYDSKDDPRFGFLMDFLEYLNEWEREVDQLNISEAEKKKLQLSPQTKVGIERTSRSFISAVKYLLKTRKSPEKGFIMGRAFQQDSLEHYYSQQHACGGGSSHPTVARFLQNQNIMEVKGSLGLKRLRGNVQPIEERVDVNEPLPKRAKPVQRKLNMDDSD